MIPTRTPKARCSTRRKRRPKYNEPEKVDWDEESFRAERAAETEEIIAEVQPGTIIEGDQPEPAVKTDPAAAEPRRNRATQWC